MDSRSSEDAWRVHLSKGDFSEARRAVRRANLPPAQGESALDQISGEEGECCLRGERGEEAADAFAQCSRRSFEEICLCFLRHGGSAGSDGLLRYLTLRWQSFASAKATSPQRSILCTWLLELHLDRVSAWKSPDPQSFGRLAEFLRAAHRRGDLNKATALSMMSSHPLALAKYCELTGEYGRIVASKLGQGDWLGAVRTIKEAPVGGAEGEWGGGGGEEAAEEGGRQQQQQQHSTITPLGNHNTRQELWYRHSAVLLPVLPSEVIEGWTQCPGLDVCRLIPTLVRYASNRYTGGAGSDLTHLATWMCSPLPGAATAAVTAPPVAAYSSVPHTLDMVLAYLESVVDSGAANGRRYTPLHNFLITLFLALPAPPPEEEGLASGSSSGSSSEGKLLEYVRVHTGRMPPTPPAGAAVADSLETGLAPSIAFLERVEAAAAQAAADAAASMASALAEGVAGAEEEEECIPPFDLAFALRVVAPAGKPRTATHLCAALGLYVEAVETALGVGDVELAKWAVEKAAEAAAGAREGSGRAAVMELVKRLWTKIACHVIAAADVAAAGGEEGGAAAGAAEQEEGAAAATSPAAAAAIAILRESNCLRVEDILAYFPGNTRLEDFKEEVTSSLMAADKKIQELRREMTSRATAAELIRGDIKLLRGRHVSFPPDARCAISGLPLFSSDAAFYSFACGHSFVPQALITTLLTSRSLSEQQKTRMGELADKLVKARTALSGSGGERGRQGGGAATQGARSALQQRIAGLQAELDETVAAQCPLCSTLMVDTIDLELENSEDRSWDL